MFPDDRHKERSLARLQSGEGTLLVSAHQFAVTSNIGCQDGGQTPPDAFFGHGAMLSGTAAREIVWTLRCEVYGTGFRLRVLAV
jgi:hypothetical protein